MSSSERLPRAILPKANQSRASESDLNGTEDQEDGASPKPVRNSPQIRSNIRSACLACRQRRSKCTGGAPCNRCQTLGTDCIYEEGQDRRTRAIRERGKEELELHKKVLEGLFSAIRNGDDKSLLALVQQNASLHEIAAAIDGETYSEEGQQESQQDGVLSLSVPENPRPGIRGEASSLDAKNHLHPALKDDVATSRFVTGDATGLVASRQWSLPMVPQLTTRLPGDQTPALQDILASLQKPESPDLDQLSRFSIQFRDSGTHMIRQGFPPEVVLGVADVHCDLLFRVRHETDTFNIYTWASAVVNGYPDLDIFFRLCWLVFLVRFMRWSVDTTEAHFAQLPALMKPTPLQVSISHALFVDLAPLPQMRDALINKPRDYCAAFQLSGVSVSWNRPLEEAVLHDPATGRMTVSRAFEEHISNPNHFFFGRAIFSVFPDLEGKLQTVDDDFIPAMTFLVPSNDGVSTSKSTTG